MRFLETESKGTEEDCDRWTTEQLVKQMNRQMAGVFLEEMPLPVRLPLTELMEGRNCG